MQPTKNRSMYEAQQFQQARHIRSPSPDKNSANIITPTRSPQLNEIKKHLTPLRTTTIRYDTDSHCCHSNQRNTRQIAFTSDNSFYGCPYCDEQACEKSCARLLKEKQETIRELRDILEMISRRGEQTPRESNDFQKQVKVLTIENQKLMSIIENNHVGVASRREDILLSQINQLEKSIVQLQTVNTGLSKKIARTEETEKELADQNQRLLRLVKESSNNSHSSSGNSLPPKQPYHFQKDKLTLVKIREQHAENIRILKENFAVQLTNVFDPMESSLYSALSKTEDLHKRIGALEKTCLSLKSMRVVERRDQNHEIEMIMLQNQESSSRLEEERRDNDYLKRELDIRKEEIIQKNRAIKELEQEIETLQINLEQAKTDRNKETLELNFIIQGLNERIKVLEVDKQDGAQWKARELNFEARLKGRESEMEKEKKLLESELEQFRNSTEGEVRRLVQNYAQQIQMLKAKAVKHSQEALGDKQKLAEAAKISEAMRVELLALQNQHQILRRRMENNEKSADQLRNTNINLQRELDGKSSESLSVLGQLTLTKQELKTTREQLRLATESSRTAREELKLALEASNRLRNAHSGLEQELKKVEEDCMSLQQALRQKDEPPSLESGLLEIRLILQQFAEAGECSNLYQAYQEAVIALEGKKNHIQLLLKEAESLRGQLSCKEEERRSLFQRLAALEREIREKDAQLQFQNALNIRLAGEKDKIQRELSLTRKLREKGEIRKKACEQTAISLEGKVAKLIELQRERSNQKIDFGSSKLTLVSQLYDMQ